MFDAISCPSAPSAAVISRVVVVLPLVPVTRTTWRPRASSDSRSGWRRRPMMPPMTEPSPFPASRETVAAAPPTVVASLARIGSLERWWFWSIAADAIRSAVAAGPRQAGSPPRTGGLAAAAPVWRFLPVGTAVLQADAAGQRLRQSRRADGGPIFGGG